jgi:diguanylate cyclase (GGDEF)-like protein
MIRDGRTPAAAPVSGAANGSGRAQRASIAINRTLRRLSRAAVLALALALVALIGICDYVTGLEISVSVFYLAPVSLAAWYGSQRDGQVLALVASLVWSGVDLFAGYAHGHPAILVWDTGMHFVFLAVSAKLLEVLRGRLADEQRLARRDPLTGVLNLRAFQERLEYSLALSARDGHPLTLAYVDLDDFKRVNDLQGHAQGDLVLSTVGQVLTEAVRHTDTVARIGGDEFALLLPGTGVAGAADVLPKLAQRLGERFGSIDASVTCSVGAVTFPRPPDGADAAIRLADRLMYEVKRRGKNAIAFATFDHVSGALVPVADNSGLTVKNAG